jgi:predicted outer membrane repeat protein
MTRTTIDANEESRIFDVAGDGGRIRNLKLFDGRGNPGFAGDGGAILASGGETTVDSVLFDRNEASNGGAIFIGQGAGVTIRNSVIQGSLAQHGGAIESAGQLRIERSTIVGNEAFSPGEGGAIDLRPASAPTITRIVSSSILTNLARAKGGAILADGNPYSGPDGPEDPQLFVVNSTIAFNRSQADAGGIMADNGAAVDIDNSSIGFNAANTDNTGTAVAGGVWQHSGASFNIDDSVIVGNSVGQGGSDPNCSGILSGLGNVLNTSATECQVSFTEPFNRYSTGTVARIPAANGGPTLTMAIPASSDAVGFASDCPKRDQRGKLRPKNCDSGAYEHRPKRKRRN